MNYPHSPFYNCPLVESHIYKRNSALLPEVLPWLCRAPKTTTFRLNLLKTTKEEFKVHLNKHLEQFAIKPTISEHPLIPELISVGPVQEKYELPPDSINFNEIIVDAACGAALLRGAHIFAPGVLAMESGTQIGDEVKVYADLAKKCRKGTCVRYESEDKLFIGVGTVQMQRHDIYNARGPRHGIAVKMQWTTSGVPSIGNIDCESQHALLQNIPSIVAVRVLDPQPNEYILDMCASPGNKTTHIAELMQDMGVVVALDKTEKKIQLVKNKIRAGGFKSIKAYAFDSTMSFDENVVQNDYEFKPPYRRETFDRILLDAPCSALGNRPLLRVQMHPNVLHSFPYIQRKLFDNALPLLKVTGILVYSTCTVTEDENEYMVAWILDKYPQLQLVQATPNIGGHGLPNLALHEEELPLVQRFGPSEELDTIGFFIAKFYKTHATAEEAEAAEGQEEEEQ